MSRRRCYKSSTNNEQAVDEEGVNKKQVSEKQQVCMPIAYIVETSPMTYNEAVLSSDAQKWSAAMGE